MSLCNFAAEIGAGLIYGMNTGHMVENLALVDDVRVNNSCPSLHAISLGNEGVPGSPAEFIALRAALDKFDAELPPAQHTQPDTQQHGQQHGQQQKRPLLVGPDSAMTPWGTCPTKNNCPGYFVPLATRIVQACGQALDAASFHVYSFKGSFVGGTPTNVSLAKGSL